MAGITNGVCTREDAEFLHRAGGLPANRMPGVETGGGVRTTRSATTPA